MRQLFLHSGFLLVLILFSSFRENEAYQCAVQEKPLVIEHFATLWQSSLIKDSSTNIYYGVTHDDQYLYVRLQTDDTLQGQAILLNGIQFRVETNENTISNWELVFPITNPWPIVDDYCLFPRPLYDTRNQLACETRRSHFNNHFLTGMAMMRIESIRDSVPLMVNNRLENGLEVILQTDSLRTLYYIAKIPLNMIFHRPKDYLLNAEKPFSFEFQVQTDNQNEHRTTNKPKDNFTLPLLSNDMNFHIRVTKAYLAQGNKHVYTNQNKIK